MSTPGSEKARLALLALAVLLVPLALFLAAMTWVSRWAEREHDAFPFKEEDWLRYVASARLEPDGRDRIMLTGPSTVRENLRYEMFEAAFPDHTIIQGGISLGTLDDVVLALEFMEATYGAAAMPDVLVLGISPRFVANIPKARPFPEGIDRYSARFSVRRADDDVYLEPKGLVSGLASRLRFKGAKEPTRFRTGVRAVAHSWLVAAAPESPQVEALAVKVSPYKYAELDPVPPNELRAWLTSPDSWWAEVFAWSPSTNAPEVQSDFARLLAVVDRHHMELVVVDMPERDLVRTLYRPESEGLQPLVRTAIGGRPFVDLTRFLGPDEFYDAEHSTPEGSARLTRAVIDQVRPAVVRSQLMDGLQDAARPARQNGGRA